MKVVPYGNFPLEQLFNMFMVKVSCNSLINDVAEKIHLDRAGEKTFTLIEVLSTQVIEKIR